MITIENTPTYTEMKDETSNAHEKRFTFPKCLVLENSHKSTVFKYRVYY